MNQSFPSSPSVEHLKKQAKALLKSCRNGEPAARRRLAKHHPGYASASSDPRKAALQETQLVIAREYGYSSWPALTASLQKTETARALDRSGILLYTNGGSAMGLLDAAGIPGQKLMWIEALHDGPVPRTATDADLYRIRAEHFARLGWTSVEGALGGFAKRDAPLSQPDEYTGLELWFEHDLYDQLQLIQLLDRLAALPGWRAKTVLYQFDTFLGHLRPEEVEKRRPDPIAVTNAHTTLATKAWNAFCAESPQSLLQIAQGNTPALPFLAPALLRLCQEFPSARNGLGRTEEQILSVVAEGNRSPEEMFRFSQKKEEAQFMGDSSFFALVQRLTRGPQPPLRTEADARFQTPSEAGYTETFRNQRLILTEVGEKALSGEHDRLTALPTEYWIGGVRIDGPGAPRWDPTSASFLLR